MTCRSAQRVKKGVPVCKSPAVRKSLVQHQMRHHSDQLHEASLLCSAQQALLGSFCFSQEFGVSAARPPTSQGWPQVHKKLRTAPCRRQRWAAALASGSSQLPSATTSLQALRPLPLCISSTSYTHHLHLPTHLVSHPRHLVDAPVRSIPPRHVSHIPLLHLAHPLVHSVRPLYAPRTPPRVPPVHFMCLLLHFPRPPCLPPLPACSVGLTCPPPASIAVSTTPHAHTSTGSALNSGRRSSSGAT